MNHYVKTALVIIALILIGGISGYLYQQNGGHRNFQPNHRSDLFQPSYNRVISSNPLTQRYTNPDYGFQLTLNQAWKNYQVFSEAERGAAVSYYLCVKTTDPAWQLDAGGYACPLYLSVMSEPEWQALAATPDEANRFELWGSKAGYVVVAETWLDTPVDLAQQDFGFPAIKDSFQW